MTKLSWNDTPGKSGYYYFRKKGEFEVHIVEVIEMARHKVYYNINDIERRFAPVPALQNSFLWAGPITEIPEVL